MGNQTGSGRPRPTGRLGTPRTPEEPSDAELLQWFDELRAAEKARAGPQWSRAQDSVKVPVQRIRLVVEAATCPDCGHRALDDEMPTSDGNGPGGPTGLTAAPARTARGPASGPGIPDGGFTTDRNPPTHPAGRLHALYHLIVG